MDMKHKWVLENKWIKSLNVRELWLIQQVSEVQVQRSGKQRPLQQTMSPRAEIKQTCMYSTVEMMLRAQIMRLIKKIGHCSSWSPDKRLCLRWEPLGPLGVVGQQVSQCVSILLSLFKVCGTNVVLSASVLKRYKLVSKLVQCFFVLWCGVFSVLNPFLQIWSDRAQGLISSVCFDKVSCMTPRWLS